MTTLSLVSSLAVGITLCLSGIFKMTDLALSGYMVQRLRVFPAPLDQWFGRLLPFAEVGLGTLLVTGWGGRLVSLCALGLALGFGFASLQAVTRKEEVACNCFGRAMVGRLGVGSFLHAALLIILLIAVLLFPSSAPAYFRANSWLNSLLLLLPAMCLIQLGFILRLADTR